MFEDVFALAPLSFFSVSYEAKMLPASRKTFFTKEFLLPSTAEYLDEEEFAQIFFAWNEENVFLHAEVNEAPSKSSFPNYRSGDSLEFFFDTRDLKSRLTFTQFCHHFVFFPEEMEGGYGQEITRFRSEAVHPLCNPKDLKVDVDIQRSSYRISIAIPHFCLHGFDPRSFDRLGFTYRVNRANGMPQSFAVSCEEYKIELHPQLWASFKLVK